MGWSFRRSKKFGPVRFNFSKSGMGGSIGVPGFRAGIDGKGRRYTHASIPGTGIYKRSYHGGGSGGLGPDDDLLMVNAPEYMHDTPPWLRDSNDSLDGDTLAYAWTVLIITAIFASAGYSSKSNIIGTLFAIPCAISLLIIIIGPIVRMFSTTIKPENFCPRDDDFLSSFEGKTELHYKEFQEYFLGLTEDQQKMLVTHKIGDLVNYALNGFEVSIIVSKILRETQEVVNSENIADWLEHICWWRCRKSCNTPLSLSFQPEV